MKTFLCALMALLLAGCSKPTDQQIDAGIDIATPVGIQKILERTAKKAPDTTRAAAKQFSAFINSDAIPFVQNGSIPAAQLIPQLEDLLLSKLDPSYETGVIAVLGLAAANVNLSAPKMSDAEKQHILHSLKGIARGCDLFLAGKTSQLWTPAPVDAAEHAAGRIPDAEQLGETSDKGMMTWGEMLPPPKEYGDEGPIKEAAYSPAGGTQINPKGCVLIEFTAQYCPACDRMDAVLDDLREAKVYNEIHIIDVDDNPKLASEREIAATPTFIIYKNGKEIDRHTGLHTKAELTAWACPGGENKAAAKVPVKTPISLSSKKSHTSAKHRVWVADYDHGQGAYVEAP